jgi:uncharacterized protein (TIGR02722 family)
MAKALLISLLLGCAAVLYGCQPKTENIDTINDPGKPVMGLDYRDFDRAASEMIQSMVGAGVLNKPGGGRYVVTTGRIINDTMQRIDTDQLMAKVEQELTNTGMVVMTAAVGGQGAPDSMVYDVRDLRDSDRGDEFDQDTMQKKGQLVAPELSMAGKIIQRNVKYDNNMQQVEYYFQLQLNDLTTGLRFWQNEVVLGKRGSDKSVSW